MYSLLIHLIILLLINGKLILEHSFLPRGQLIVGPVPDVLTLSVNNDCAPPNFLVIDYVFLERLETSLLPTLICENSLRKTKIYPFE